MFKSCVNTIPLDKEPKNRFWFSFWNRTNICRRGGEECVCGVCSLFMCTDTNTLFISIFTMVKNAHKSTPNVYCWLAAYFTQILYTQRNDRCASCLMLDLSFYLQQLPTIRASTSVSDEQASEWKHTTHNPFPFTHHNLICEDGVSIQPIIMHHVHVRAIKLK